MSRLWFFCLAIAISTTVFAVTPTRDEMRLARTWAQQRFGGKSPTPPISLNVGEHPFSATDGTWTVQSSTKRLDSRRVQRILTYTQPTTGMVVICRATEWSDFPVVEWMVDLRNGGNADSPMITEVRPLDVTLTANEFQLHSNTGDNAALESYAPHVDVMGPSMVKRFHSNGGRPTTGDYPYWNVETPGGGAITVLSWAGQWSSEFQRDGGNSLNLKAGQETTHFVLHPGEQVRTPLAITMFYQGDWIRGQNLWRRWMLADNSPRINGKLPVPLFESNANGYFDGLRDSIKDEELFVDRFAKEKIGVGFWDLDAGWYPCETTKQWWEVGTWEPDPVRWPQGMKPLSDFMHERGIKLILWNEPERVYSGTWMAKNHPDWIYGGAGGGLLKLGLPECRQWVTDHFDRLITEQGVDVYRQDFNIDPLPYWQKNDAPDRQGITEIRHVEGYYAYWDELLKRHPGLIIDTCASGGRRNNLETLRRSVPILRSDDQMIPLDEQCHTFGISLWVPINGSGVTMSDDYTVRSCMSTIFGIGADVRGKVDWNAMRRDAKDWRELSQAMLGDYYPLTPYSASKADWVAWQWDVPEKGFGMIQAFRREDATADTLAVKLSALKPEASYNVTDVDGSPVRAFTGKQLMEGLEIHLPKRPSAAVLRYARQR